MGDRENVRYIFVIVTGSLCAHATLNTSAVPFRVAQPKVVFRRGLFSYAEGIVWSWDAAQDRRLVDFPVTPSWTTARNNTVTHIHASPGGRWVAIIDMNEQPGGTSSLLSKWCFPRQDLRPRPSRLRKTWLLLLFCSATSLFLMWEKLDILWLRPDSVIRLISLV